MQHINLEERILIWVAFDFPELPHPDFGLLCLLRNGRTGFRGSGAPPVGTGRPGASSRLSDRSLRTRLCAACRSLPAGEILSLAHTNGSPLRQWINGQFLSFLHGDLSGQQSGLSPVAPVSPVPAAFLTLLTLIPGRTPLQRLTNLVPPFT